MPALAIELPAERGPVAAPVAAPVIARDPTPFAQVGFVATVGDAHWFVLPVDPATLSAHAARHLIERDDVYSTVQPLRARELTPAVRAWLGETVVVDGTCRDELHDFAIVAQLTGDPAYAGIEPDASAPRWTAASVAEHGTVMVAARLAHCAGTYAVAASAPAIVPFAAIDGEPHVAAARAALMSSPLAATARASYDAELGTDTSENSDASFDRAVEVTTLAARDPRTGTVWIAVHASAPFACGGPSANFWALDRVEGDQLVTVAQGATDDLGSIDALVDLGGDDTPEVLGAGWLAPTHAFYAATSLAAADLEALGSFSVPFFGCPC